MTERREIKQRSPAVWARVRAAYLAGEPAASVARRFDVGYGNLRYRANAEGWTRKAAMTDADEAAAAEDVRLAGRADPVSEARCETPVEIDPADAFEAALARAGVAIAAGRGAEAAGLLKAAETLVRLREASPPEHLPTVEEWDAEQAALRAAWADEKAAWREAESARLEEEWGRRALTMAHVLLSARGHDLADNWAASALRWRAETLGPDQALADFARGVSGGWASRYWDEHGRLKPVEPPPAPESRMMRQHVGLTRGGFGGEIDMSGIEWPPAWATDGRDEEPRQPVEPSDVERGPRVRRL
ncbi:hypothetical protein [Brevundimonas sp.]|uniref:hypothetical protein n=1 Tax=Brevundimonas sp. TaxID=1871086 RepID=UPI00286C3BCA|nr:hypothetical protein [Brevundimonas sp.]